MTRALALAAVAALGCHAQFDDRPLPDLAMPPDLQPMKPIPISLIGDWQFSSDAQLALDPAASVTSNTETSVTVSFAANTGGCGCSAQRLVVPLPQPVPCEGTTLSFTWGSAGHFDFNHSTALRVGFGASGELYEASTWIGHSNCAWDGYNNYFPDPAQLAFGHNDIDLGKLVWGTNGHCTQPIVELDIHVEGYACDGTLQATLSDVVLH